MFPDTIGGKFEKLGTLLQDSMTTLGEVQEASAELGMAIQYRIVPFDQTIYTLNVISEADKDEPKT